MSGSGAVVSRHRRPPPKENIRRGTAHRAHVYREPFLLARVKFPGMIGAITIETLLGIAVVLNLVGLTLAAFIFFRRK